MGWATETLLRLERRRLRPKGSVSSAYLSWLWGGTDAKSASEATVRRTPAFQLSTDGPTSAKAHTTGMQFTTGGSATASEASGVDTGQWCRRGSGVGCVSPLRSDDSANATVNATALHMAARTSQWIYWSKISGGARRENATKVSCATECTRPWKIWQRDRDIFVRCGHANDACAWWWSSFHFHTWWSSFHT